MPKLISNGIFKNNPIFVQVLGICPVLATTSSMKTALGMAVAFSAVLIFSNMIISAAKKSIPSAVRIPCYIVIIASLVTVIELLMQALTPNLYKELGIFIPLIVVNCIILGRAEAFANKNSVFNSLQDAIGVCIGFTIALLVISTFRELLGSGSILGYQVLGASYKPILLLILPAGAFFSMGFIFAGLRYLKERMS
jgi:electron transport complex protein RnfE